MTVSPAASIAICQWMRARGFDPDPALEASGVDALALRTGRRIDAARAMSLWQEAERITGDAAIALRVAEWVPIGAHHVVDSMVMASGSPRAALGRAARYFGLINARSSIQLVPSRRGLAIEIHDDALPARYAEYVFASIVARTRAATWFGWTPAEVHFGFARPPHEAEYERAFRCRIRFREPQHRLLIDREGLATPQPHADEELCAILERHAEGRLDELAGANALAADVRTIVRRAMDAGRLSLDATARELGLSSRTLQREMLAAGESYRAIVDAVRRDRVLAAVRDGCTNLSALTAAGGFADTRALLRAFRRWTGTTPRRFGAAGR